ncbi:MAG TPA: hypothetical protein VEC16_07105 [Alphaproteobacteria bacterium]|nr:hypothetical protein [Alphaproteobacteria bacterium]
MGYDGDGMCRKCSGMTKALVGVLILINAFVWPQWTGIDGWIAFFAVLLVFAGIAKSFFAKAACCEAACCDEEHHHAAPAKKSKK